MRHELSNPETQALVTLWQARHDADLPPGPYRVAIVGLERPSSPCVCRVLDAPYDDIGSARAAAQAVRVCAREYAPWCEGVRVIVADNPTFAGVVSY